MGSFSATCGISGLGINSGDKVKFLLLTGDHESSDENIQCYPNSKWQVFTVPFDAKYNDYGSVKDYDEKDPHFVFAMQSLRDNLVERDIGKNKYHDVAVKKTSTDKELLTALWENRVLSKDNARAQDLYIRPCIIRADVWDLMLEQKFVLGWESELLAYDPSALDEDFKQTLDLLEVPPKDRFDQLMTEPYRFNAFCALGVSNQFNTIPKTLWFELNKKNITQEQTVALLPALAQLDFLGKFLMANRQALYPSHTIGEQHARFKTQAKWFGDLSKLAKKLQTKYEDED